MFRKTLAAGLLGVAVTFAAGCGSDSGEVDAGQSMEAHPVEITPSGLVLGDPQAANKVVIYEDFNCPHCVELHSVLHNKDAVDQWIADGASVEVVPVNYLGPRTTHDFSGRAAAALRLVAEKHPNNFGAAQAALFTIRPDATTSTLEDADIFNALKDAGVPLTAEDEKALTDGEYKAWVDAATHTAAQNGVNYIPQVWVNGELIDKEKPEDVYKAVKVD